MHFVIRRPRENDAGALAAMANVFDVEDMGQAALRPYTPEIILRDMIAPTALMTTWVAMAGTELVGYANHLPAYHSETATPARWMENLYVAPAWRRRGVARALMTAVARDALELGCDAVYWGVRKVNDEGRLFYDRIGADSEEADIRVLYQTALESLAGA